MLWLRAKQEVHPDGGADLRRAGGAAGRRPPGRSRKCLVLDLDNTLWGGVIGDDGLEGIVLGQGSALGEAFLASRAMPAIWRRAASSWRSVRRTTRRTRCAPFDSHPEMLLKLAISPASSPTGTTKRRTSARSRNS